MKTYKELVQGLYEEVSKIDVSKLNMTSFGGGLKDYVELLKAMSTLPPEGLGDKLDMCYTQGFGGFPVPKVEENKQARDIPLGFRCGGRGVFYKKERQEER